MRRRLGVRRGPRGEGPGLVRARLVRCVVAGSMWRCRLRGIVMAAARGVVEVVGVGVGVG